MKEVFGAAALVVSLAASVPYIADTIRGKIQPERISWLLWTMLGATYFMSAVQGDGAVLYTLGELVGPGATFLLTLKYGVGGRSRFDVVSLAIALVAFLLIFATHDVVAGLVLAVIVDAIGALLTIRKLKIDPSSESLAFWVMAGVASLLALASLDVYNLVSVLFPAYVMILSIYISLNIRKTAVSTRDKISQL
jgi:hypothetical protein